MAQPWDYIAKLVCIGDSGTGKSSVRTARPNHGQNRDFDYCYPQCVDCCYGFTNPFGPSSLRSVCVKGASYLNMT